MALLPRIGLGVFCIALLFCTRSRSNLDGGVAGRAGGDAAHGGAGDNPKPRPVDGGFCCPIDDTPGCCMSYGGFTPRFDGCGYTCDGMPSPYEKWTRGVDAHDCPIWIEPEHWTDCCGCFPLDAGHDTGTPVEHGPCDATGTWNIHYDTMTPCGLTDESVQVSIASDDDTGTDDVVFDRRKIKTNNCSSSSADPYSGSTYSKDIVASASGCEVTLSSNETHCYGGEKQCEKLTLVLHLDNRAPNTASFDGTYGKCWCNNDVWGRDNPVAGTATRISHSP